MIQYRQLDLSVWHILYSYIYIFKIRTCFHRPICVVHICYLLGVHVLVLRVGDGQAGGPHVQTLSSLCLHAIPKASPTRRARATTPSLLLW